MLWPPLRPHLSQHVRLCSRQYPILLSRRSFNVSHRLRFPNEAKSEAAKVLEAEIPSFREQIGRNAGVSSFVEKVKKPKVLSQVLFFLFGSYFVYATGAISTNVETEYWCKRLAMSSPVWADRIPTNDEMRRTQYFELGKVLQARLASIREATAELPLVIKNSAVLLYVSMAQPYLDTTEGRRICWKICALNTVVWLAWKLPKWEPWMRRNFMHHPLSGLSYTLLTSMFSHKSLLHLGVNCMALSSFGSAASHFMSKEQNKSNVPEANSKWHFLAFFVSAGLFSGLVSHVVSARLLYPRLIAQMASKPITATAATTATATSAAASAITSQAAPAATKTVADILPSLGASGAIYAAVTLTALGFPETEVALIIPPSFPIPIQWGVSGMVALDIVGVLRGWRLFDHWAHLGGAAFGVLYYNYGAQWWNAIKAFYPVEIEVSDSTAT